MSNNTTRPVKVRFAPSPTGTPHVGLIRTALYNWAYAKAMGGTFLFRIEDTDIERDSEDSFDQIIEAMEWLGITTDEGVIAGGDHAPYRQSERRHIYDEVLSTLLAKGYLYESFSNKDEIDARNLAAGRRIEQGYDNFDRNTTAEDAAAFRAEGRLPVYRMRMPDTDITFIDLVRGEITFPVVSATDYVVARADGSPLYSFVNPVDDALMGVTHILRGEDLLSSTPRQLALWHALVESGYAEALPTYAHLPFILAPNSNKKMSKRDPKSNLFNLRDEGYTSEGLLNYLALLGWGIAPDNDVFTMDEMVAAFDVADVSSSSSQFDEKKARAINAEHIRRMDDGALIDYLIPLLAAEGLITDEADDDTVEALLPVLKARIHLLPDAIDYMRPILDKGFVTTSRPTSTVDYDNVMAALSLAAFTDDDAWDVDSLTAAYGALIENDESLTNKTMWTPVRAALTNSKFSLPLFDIMAALGKKETIVRLTTYAVGA